MDFRFLGRTGLNISPICIGTMNFGSPLEEQAAGRLVSHALDHGVNFFDTANVYEGYSRTFGSPGEVGETLLGKSIQGRRDEAVICTKLGNPNGIGPLNAGLSARHLHLELDNSLRRLQTDWVDLLLAHRTDPHVAVEDVWNTFDRLVQSGKVRSVGVSNWPSWTMAKVSELAARHGWPRCAASSPQYSLLNRDIELEHIPACSHYEVGLMPYKGLMGGALTGKYRRDQSDYSGTRAAEKAYWTANLDDVLFDKLEAYQRVVNRAGLSMAEYSIAWLLARPMVASIILGFRSTEQLDEAIAAAGKTVPHEDQEEIDAIFTPPSRPGGEQVLRWRGEWVLDDREE
jgi:aryl-alcohol dehydrogenase-like predicted oxidoreductase